MGKPEHRRTAARACAGVALPLYLVFFLMLATPAAADVYTVEKKKKEIEEVTKEIESERQKGLPKAQQMQALSQSVHAEHERLQSWSQQLDRTRDNFNARCAGRPVNGGCEAERARYLADERDYNGANSAYSARANEVTRLYSEVTLINARMKKLDNYRSQLMQALQRDIDETKAACGSARSPEEMKNRCGNIQFDGAAAMGACTTQKCREYDALRR